MRGKDRTYVIDFVNEPQEILDAFRLFYREARIEEVQDPNISTTSRSTWTRR